MKKTIDSDIQKLEKKINLLNDKIDKLMAAQGVSLQSPEEINEEEEKKRKIREKQQVKILEQWQAGFFITKKQTIPKRLMVLIESSKVPGLNIPHYLNQTTLITRLY